MKILNNDDIAFILKVLFGMLVAGLLFWATVVRAEVRIYTGTDCIGRPNGTTYNSGSGNLVCHGDTIHIQQVMDTTSVDTLIWEHVSYQHGVEWFEMSKIVNYSTAGWDTIPCSLQYGLFQAIVSGADSIRIWPNDTSATPVTTANSFEYNVADDLARIIVQVFDDCQIEFHFSN